MNKPELVEKLVELGVKADMSMPKPALEKMFEGAAKETPAPEDKKEIDELIAKVEGRERDAILQKELNLLNKVRAEENEALDRPVSTEVWASRVDSRVLRPNSQFNQETHYAIKKSAFDQLIVNLIANRTKMYARGAMPSRLMEMLGLKDNADAQKVLSEIYLRVANG